MSLCGNCFGLIKWMKAQNNRRVNIRKLKLLLEKLDGAELVKESTYWSVKFTQTYCDYIEVCNCIDKVKNNEPITATNTMICL